MKRIKRKKVKAFLLIEIMVALALATLCLTLLLYPHFSCMKEEMKQAKEVQLERLADTIHLKMLWTVATNRSLSLPPAWQEVVFLGPKEKRACKASVTFDFSDVQWRGERQLAMLIVILDEKPYEYTAFLRYS